MTIEKISGRLVELLRNKEFQQAQQELFDPDVLSLEPEFHTDRMTSGLRDLVRKEQKFLSNVTEWCKLEITEPIISKNHFVIRMSFKLLMRSNQELELDELILYQVQNGKIIKEQFFYANPKSRS